MNLIILTEADRIDSERFRLLFHRAEHIRSILGCVEGDTVEIGLVNGPAGQATVESISDYEVVLRASALKSLPVPIPAVDLICALPRPQTLKKVLTTAAMMGVRRLHLIRANRVEKSYFHSPLLEPSKYTTHLIDGLSQGKLTRMPEVQVHDRFKVFFEDTFPALESNEGDRALRLLPDLDSSMNLRAFYRGGDVHRMMIAVGPEGGWVPFEVDIMREQGFKRFSLGRWVLRVEHAVTAVLSQVELLRSM